MSESILYEKVGQIAKIWLNRPEHRNTFTKEMTDRFAEALARAGQDTDVRVIVIQGKGKDFNCSYDHSDPEVILLAEGEEVSFDARRLDTQHDIDYWFKVFDVKKPIITGIRGECLACGVWISQFSDVVIASTDVEFHALEYPIGLNGSDILPIHFWKLPMNIAMEFALTGYPIDAKTGHKYGLFNHIVEPEKVDEACMKMASRMLRLNPYTLAIQHELGSFSYELKGMRHIIPLAKESYNCSTTCTTTPESEAHWQWGREHGLSEMSNHFFAMMNSLREQDDWDLGDVEL